MLTHLRPALASLGLLTVLTGLLYPLVVTGIAQAAFPKQANGSVVSHQGKELGSALIGQPFTEPKYFWSRPSATTPAYNGGSSAGANQGPTNPALALAVQARIKALRE